MNQNRKFITKVYAISFGLSFAAVLVSHFTNSNELLLLTRLIGSAFFFYLYLFMTSMIKKQDKMIKDSHGFMERAFDPKVLQTTLLLFIAGWSTFAVMDYFGINTIDWIMIFVLGIIIIPIRLGLIPLGLKDNPWRK